MSYARFSDDSDVYVYHHVAGFIECCGCWMASPEGDEDIAFTRLATPRRAIMHLMEHVSRGYKVPDSVFDRIYNEYRYSMDDAVQPFIETPEQTARQKARLDRLRQTYKEQIEGDTDE